MVNRCDPCRLLAGACPGSCRPGRSRVGPVPTRTCHRPPPWPVLIDIFCSGSPSHTHLRFRRGHAHAHSIRLCFVRHAITLQSNGSRGSGRSVALSKSMTAAIAVCTIIDEQAPQLRDSPNKILQRPP